MKLRENDHWALNPDITFLNHGSFGATPKSVLRFQRELQDALERDPIQFLAPERELEPKLDRVRQVVAGLVNADPRDIGFVRSATDGVNSVVRSLKLVKDDELVITNHGYNACNNAVKFAAERSEAHVREARIPFPIVCEQDVVDAIEKALTARTRLLIVDHVTSPTGLVLPIREIIALAHSRNVRVLVDGAHAPGMVDIDLRSLDGDYYTANHHKWLCAPKSSGFLWVRRELQEEVRPTVISHGANRARPNRSRFLTEFDWTGTFDPTPLLCVPAAIDFLSGRDPGGLTSLQNSNRELALQARRCLTDSLGIQPPAPIEMIGALVTVVLPSQRVEPIAGGDSTFASENTLQQRLFNQHRIEVPIFPGLDPRENPGQHLLRVSCQVYNDATDYERLAESLASELGR